MDNKYAQGCWEERTIDPLRDPQREQLHNDPFWQEQANIPNYEGDYRDSKYLIDDMVQYPLEEDI